MTRPASSRRIAANSVSGVVTLLVNIFFVFWLYQYLLKRIPAEDFAVYPVLMTIMMLGPVITSFFASALSREVIIAYSQDRRRDVTILHSTTVIGLALFLAAVVALGLLAALTIERLINIPPGMLVEVRWMTFLVTVDLCVSLFGVPFSTAFEVRQKYMERDAITIVTGLFKIALTFALLVGLGPRVLWVPVASLVATVLAVAAIIHMSRRTLPEFRISVADFRLEVVRAILSFGAWTSLGTFSMLVYQSAAPVILNILSGPIHVTTYFIGSLFDRRISSLMTVALAPIQPLMISMSARGDFSRIGFVYLRGGCYALWFAMALAVPLMIFAPEFVQLYLGPGFEEAAVVMRILLAVMPTAFAHIMLSRVAIATGRVRGFFGGALLTSILVLLSMIGALWFWQAGAVAAALAQAAVNLVATFLYFWPLGLRLTGLRFVEFLRGTVLRGLAPSLGGLSLWLPLKYLGFGESWAGLILSSMAGGVLYLGAGWLFCLAPDERAGVARVLARVTGRRF